MTPSKARRDGGCPSGTGTTVLLVLGALIGGLVLFASPGAAETVVDETEGLTADDGAAFDWYGASVAIDNGTALVGAPDAEDSNGDETGAAYVYVRNATGLWERQAKLFAGDGQSGDDFGIAVSLDGDRALVGARFADTAQDSLAGATYVFDRDSTGTWTQQAKLAADDGAQGDLFGAAVSLDGDTALVGSKKAENATGSETGTAYVYRLAGGTWGQQAKLLASDGASQHRFGAAVSLDGDRALTGAPQAVDGSGDETGIAYVHKRNATDAWNEQARLLADDRAHGDEFGTAVSVDAGRALVGAEAADTPDGNEAGRAYVYEHDAGSWSQQANLTATDGDAFDRFGSSVSLDADRAVVGAKLGEDASGTATGAAYEYRYDANTDAWSATFKLLASNGGTDDRFGEVLDIDGADILVGAFLDDTANGEDAGSAYAFTAPAPPVGVEAVPGPDVDAITVSWEEPPSRSKAFVYRVLRATSSGGPYTEVATTTGSTYLDADLVADTYHYVVTAENDRSLVSDPSTEASAEPQGPPPARHLRATASSGAGEVELDWEPPADISGSFAYTVQRATSPDGPFADVATTTELTYTDSGLSDRPYYYVVRTVSDGGSESQDSNVTGVHPRPQAPAGLEAAAGGEGGEIELDWSDPGDASLFYVYRSTQEGGPYERVAETTETSYVDEGLPDDTFYYVVTALSSNIESPLSSEASAAGGFAVSTDPHETAQNDAGTGGDASDDPDDPTVLAGGELIHINGTLEATSDPVDAYGTEIDPNATIGMRFNFTSPSTMGLELELIAPNGTTVDTDVAPLEGGDVSVGVTADAGEHLQAGVWVTVLEHGLAPPEPASSSIPGGDGSAISPGVSPPSPLDADTGGMGDGLVPDLVPDRFTFVDYRDERPCDPKC